MIDFHRKPITFVKQVNLKVQDLKRVLDFYQDIIGFKVLNQTERTADLTVDGKTVLLTLEQPENILPNSGRNTGLYHFALLLPQRSDLADVVFHLTEKGIKIGSSDHLVSEALYLADPEGNGIEIYVDRSPSEWTWNKEEVAMAVDPLDFEDLLSNAIHQQWNGLPENTVMGHIHLHVSELKKTEEFYVKGLGFGVVNRFGSQALFISSGDYHHHIGLNTWNGVGAPPPPSNSAGLESFTLMLASEDARKKTVANLKNIDASVLVENDIYVTTDPSGNRIILRV